MKRVFELDEHDIQLAISEWCSSRFREQGHISSHMLDVTISHVVDDDRFPGRVTYSATAREKLSEFI